MTMQEKKWQVSCEIEMERGFFDGKRYYIQTGRFDYTGDLIAVTAMSYVFENISTVFETGPYEGFFNGTSQKDVQRMVGCGRSIFDRASTIIHRMDLIK